MWKGLSINYNYQGPGANYLVDIPLIFHAGFKHIRLLVCNYTDNTSTGVPLWKTILQYARTFDFETITIGLSSNPTTLTNGNKANFTAAFTTPSTGYAYYLQGLNDSRIVLCIGNEETYHRDGSLTDTQVRAFIRTHYTAIAAIYTVGPITYSMANGEMFPFFNDLSGSALPYPWDFASANLYSYPHGATTSGTSFNTNLSSATAWFGSDFVVSEFGPDPSGYSDGSWGHKDLYADQFVLNLHDIIDHDILIAAIYNFQDSLFGCKSPNGTFRPWWFDLRGEPRPFNVGMV